MNKEEIIKHYDTFLCDGRVYFILRKLLGKPFYSLKQFPLTINLDYKKMILKIINIVQNILFFI